MNNIYSSQDQEFISESGIKLSATLTKPISSETKLFPAVLFIPGSGKVDRDVNTPNLKTNIFKLMANFFSELGFITMRFDKRGCGKSGGNYIEAGLSDFINDAKSALDTLKSVPEVDPTRVLILGHSEGAFIAPTLDKDCHGLILLCGSARAGHKLLPEQPKQLITEIKESKSFQARLLKIIQIPQLINWQFNRLVKKVLSSEKSVIKVFGLVPFNAKWLREFYHFNTPEILKQVSAPTLIVGGGKDIQVKASEVSGGCELVNNANGVVIDGMNHLLRETGEPHHLLTLLKEYRDSVKQPLSGKLLDNIMKWCQQYKFITQETLEQ